MWFREDVIVWICRSESGRSLVKRGGCGGGLRRRVAGMSSTVRWRSLPGGESRRC